MFTNVFPLLFITSNKQFNEVSPAKLSERDYLPRWSSNDGLTNVKYRKQNRPSLINSWSNSSKYSIFRNLIRQSSVLSFFEKNFSSSPIIERSTPRRRTKITEKIQVNDRNNHRVCAFCPRYNLPWSQTRNKGERRVALSETQFS